MTWQANQRDRDWPFDLLATGFQLKLHSAALLVIDMHAKDVEMDAASELAISHPEIRKYWNARLSESVIPNVRQLIDVFRARQRPVVFTRNGHLTSTGREMTRRLRTKGAAGEPREFAHPSRIAGHGIDSRIAPREEDLVVDKLTSGAFTASVLDHALRNMEVKGLVITGILTDMCVLGTARSAAEIGYDSLICEDACGTLTQRAHEEALLMHARVFGRVATTADVIAELRL
jgi:nicotinamidase-related amidase